MYLAVTTGSNSADSQIAEAHEANGMTGISNLFQRSVGLEVTLSWLASVDHLIKTGDIEGAKSLLAYTPADPAPSSPAGRRMMPLARARRVIRPTSAPRTDEVRPLCPARLLWFLPRCGSGTSRSRFRRTPNRSRSRQSLSRRRAEVTGAPRSRKPHVCGLGPTYLLMKLQKMFSKVFLLMSQRYLQRSPRQSSVRFTRNCF